jgi:4-methyl-5(b-hydroxyethyl)-thiazole monophosphate biosynthesis
MSTTLLLLAEGFEIYEASCFIDVLGWNKLEGDKSTSLHTCGNTKEVKSTFNQTFKVDNLISEINIDDYDALAIPGGFEQFGFYQSAFSDSFQELIIAFHKQKKPITSICTGAIPIAKSGVLNNLEATTYASEQRLNMLNEFGAKAINQPIVISDNIITSQNPSTGLDVAFHLLTTLTSKENSKAVKALMGF